MLLAAAAAGCGYHPLLLDPASPFAEGLPLSCTFPTLSRTHSLTPVFPFTFLVPSLSSLTSLTRHLRHPLSPPPQPFFFVFRHQPSHSIFYRLFESPRLPFFYLHTVLTHNIRLFRFWRFTPSPFVIRSSRGFSLADSVRYYYSPVFTHLLPC